MITGDDEVRLGFYDGAEWRADADAMPIHGQAGFIGPIYLPGRNGRIAVEEPPE